MKARSGSMFRCHTRACLAGLVLWAACLLTPVSVQAKGPAKLAPAEVEALVKKAKTLVATRNVVQALAIYEQLHEATGTPKYLYNIGYLHEDVGQLDVAWDYYQRFLLAWPDAPNATELQTYLGELAEELGKAYVLVHVFSAPPGASVEIVTGEGTRQPSGVTPMSTWMPFGKVLVRLRLEGHATLDKKITVKRRKSQRLRLTMEPVAQPGLLTCGEMEEGMTLRVDGEVRPDATTGARLSLAPGEHTLVLTLADGSERTIIVTVAEGAVSDLPADWWSGPIPAPPAAEAGSEAPADTDVDLTAMVTLRLEQTPVGTWVTGGVAVATAVSAAVIMGLAHQKARKARQSAVLLGQHHADGLASEADQQYWIWKAQDEDAQTLQTTSIALFAVAGASTAASLIWLLIDSPSEAPSDMTLVTPIFLDDGLGAAATWRF